MNALAVSICFLVSVFIMNQILLVSRMFSSRNRCMSSLLGSSSWYLETNRLLSMPARAYSTRAWSFCLRTQQDADREIVAVGHHVLAIPTNVGVELADILVGEVLNLQIDQHMALQNPVIEDKIDKTIGVTDQNPFLPGLETEAMTEFQQEVL